MANAPKRTSRAEYGRANKWLQRLIDRMIQKSLTNMGIPRLMNYGVIKTITVSGAKNGLSVADVYLNGSVTAATNIPVNPDIASGLSVGDPVWVMNVNFNSGDMYVIARHNGYPVVSGVIGDVTTSGGQSLMSSSGVLSEMIFESSGGNQGWQDCGWYNYSSAVNTMALLWVYIPANFTITSATLYSKHLPYYENDAGGTKWWFLTNGQLMYAEDATNAFYNGQVDSFVQVNNMTDITSATWGSYWNPTSETVEIKSCDVSQYLAPGERRAFGVNSHDATNTAGQISGMMQFELVVTGYKSS